MHYIILHKSPTISELNYGRYTSNSCVKWSIIREYYIGSSAKQGAKESNNLVYTSMRRDITSPEAIIIKGHRMLGAEQLYTNKQVQLGGKDKEKRGLEEIAFTQEGNANGWYNEGTKNKWEDAEMRRIPGKGRTWRR